MFQSILKQLNNHLAVISWANIKVQLHPVGRLNPRPSMKASRRSKLPVRLPSIAVQLRREAFFRLHASCRPRALRGKLRVFYPRGRFQGFQGTKLLHTGVGCLYSEHIIESQRKEMLAMFQLGFAARQRPNDQGLPSLCPSRQLLLLISSLVAKSRIFSRVLEHELC